MSWEKIDRTFWKTQTFNKTVVVSGKSMNFVLPEDMRNTVLQWYFDKDALVAKLVVENTGQHSATKSTTVPKRIRQHFDKETNLLVFKTKNCFYIGSYRKGKETFEKFLKKDGITLFE